MSKETWSTKRYLTFAQVSLLKSKNPVKTMSDLRGFIPSNLFSEVLQWLHQNPRQFSRVFNQPFPGKLEEWKTLPAFVSSTTKREIKWFQAYISPHYRTIAQFVSLSADYDVAFLKAKTERCKEILDAVKEKFGISFWYFTRRLVLLQITDGLEAQKKFSAEIKNDPACVPIVKYLIHFLSYRTEIAVSPIRFEKEYRRSLLALNAPSNLKAYLGNQIIPGPLKKDDIVNVLTLESNGSVIDYYETFVSMVQMAAANGWSDFLETSVPVLGDAIKFVSDLRIRRLLFEFGSLESDDLLATENDLAVYNLFLTGEYAEALRQGDDGAALTPGTLYVLSLCKSATPEQSRQENQNVYGNVLENLRALTYPGSQNDDARSSVTRFTWALNGSSFSCFFKALLKWEQSAVPLMSLVPQIEFDYMALGRLHPTDAWWGNTRSNGQLPNASSSDFVDWDRAKNYIIEGDYENALLHARKLFSSAHPFYRRLAFRIIPYCLHKLGRNLDYVEEIVNIYLNDNHSINILPIVDAEETTTKIGAEKFCHLLSYAILCKLYVLRTGVPSQHQCSYACEDFLSVHNLRRPSHLRSITEKFERNQLVYFLKEICTEQVMDTWMEFGDSQDIAKERVEICQLLVDLDPDNIQIYHDEIKSIIRRLTIKAKIREIEKSKIYVDTESVKKAAITNLKENYLRYISFLQTEIYKEGMEIRESTKKKLESGGYEAVLSMSVPSNEMTDLLANISMQLRDEYVSSSQHGLDGYLSVRIRHGTLVGQLRAPLEAQSLLTQKDSETKKYKPNEHWVNELLSCGYADKEKVFKAFDEFSVAFEAIVERIKNEWLQIKKDGTGKGLFEFSILPGEVQIFSVWIESNTSFEIFLDKILEHFTERLESCLDMIRKKLQNETKQEFNTLLLRLQEQIESTAKYGDAGRFRSAIARARTEMQITLDRIIEWFHLSRDAKKEPFSVEDVVNSSAVCIQVWCPHFKSKFTDNTKDFRVQGNLFAGFTDILFLIFENVVKHSCITNPTAEVSANLNDLKLTIRVENKIGSEVANDAIRDAVTKTLIAVKEQPYSKSVTREGGTGFYKIQKILHHDFQHCEQEPVLNFGFNGNESFFVEIEIYFNKITQAEEPDEQQQEHSSR